MEASLTEKTESLCSFIRLSLPLWFSGAETGSVLDCEFFLSPPLLQLHLKTGTSRNAALSAWHVALLPGLWPAVSGCEQQWVSSAEDLLFPWMWVPLWREHMALPSLSSHHPSKTSLWSALQTGGQISCHFLFQTVTISLFPLQGQLVSFLCEVFGWNGLTPLRGRRALVPYVPGRSHSVDHLWFFLLTQ